MSEQAERIAKALCTVDGMKAEDEAVLVELLEVVIMPTENIGEGRCVSRGFSVGRSETKYHEPEDWLEWD